MVETSSHGMAVLLLRNRHAV